MSLGLFSHDVLQETRGGAQKIHGESLEEGLQGGWAEFVKQAARVVSDKTKGTSFGTKIDVGKIFQQTLEDYTASLVPMGIDMFASQGLSFAMRLPLDAKMVSDANGRFERSGDVANIDSIGTYGLIPTKKDVATVQETEGSRQAATSNETGKRKPFDVYEDKYGGLHAVHQEDAQAIRDMKREGVTGVRVNVVNREGSGSPLANLADGDKRSFARFAEEAGSALGASGIGEDKQGRHVLVFQDKEGMEAAYAQLRGEAMDTDIDQDGTRAVVSFVQRAENGNTAYQELVLTTKEEEIAENKHVPTDTFEDDVADMELERPLSVAMLDQDSAVSAQEVRALRTKLRDNYGITGRKNKAAAQAYAVASGILHVPSLDLADRLRIVFEGDEAARAELRGNGFSEERGANGWMTNEGGDGFTIHLTRTATPATLFHETGHIVRALASADQLADVERVYGVQGHQWTRVAEERFADDFVRYLRTRQAPTAKIRYLFDQIRKLLSYITGGKYAESLSDETARAFERLWNAGDTREVKRSIEGGKRAEFELPDRNEELHETEKRSSVQKMITDFYQLASNDEVSKFEKLVKNSDLRNRFPDVKRFEDFVVDVFTGVMNRNGSGVYEIGDVGSAYSKTELNGARFGVRRNAVTKHLNRDVYHDLGPVGWDAVIHSLNSPLAITEHHGKDGSRSYRSYLGLSIEGKPIVACIQKKSKKQAAIAFIMTAFGKQDDLIAPGDKVLFLNGDYNTKEKPLFVNAAARTLSVLYNNKDSILSITPITRKVNASLFEPTEGTPSMAEVRRKYEGTDQWMKAPNGEQTRLDERQWLQVRTPEFKRWFGDWEKAADYEWLMSSEPVTNLTGEELSTGMVEGANSFFETKYGGKVYRDGIGTIMLTRRGINSSIAHGVGRLKAAAFIAVPDVIAKGRVFGITENYKGRGYTSIVIDAPIRIGEKEYVCEVVVNKKGPSGVFYLHEVEVKEKLSVGNQVRAYNGQGQMRNANGKASRLIVSKLAAEGNFNSSKVLDENGEPMVVDGVFLSLDSDAVLRKIQARKLQAEVLAGRIRDAERDSGARYGTMDFAYANPEVSEDIALGADDVRLLAEAIYKGNAPELVVGFRYGDIPKAMMPYNHRDQYLEAGVSIVGRVRDLNTRKSGFYEMLLGNEPYNVVVGLYAGNHGADGEMLLAPVYKLGLASDVGKLAKSATDNNGQFDNGNDSILFELTDKETADIVRQVDSLTKQDIGKPHAVIDISSHTPFVFTELGFDDLKVVMYRDKLARGLYLPEDRKHGHEEGLDKGIVKDVLASFADPLYVFDSKTDDNSLVAVYDVLDKHDNPMMASVTIDKNASQVLVNLVTSIYGKARRKYQSWVDSGLLQYVDDARKDLSEAVRLQLPSVSERSSKDNLLYKSQLVNKPGAFFELAEDEEVSPKTLFELTDEQRDGFVKKWRTDVERAVRNTVQQDACSQSDARLMPGWLMRLRGDAYACCLRHMVYIRPIKD